MCVFSKLNVSPNETFASDPVCVVNHFQLSFGNIDMFFLYTSSMVMIIIKSHNLVHLSRDSMMQWVKSHDSQY